MRKPALVDYGLSQADAEALQRFDERVWTNIGCILVALSGAGGVIKAAVESNSWLEFLVGAFFFGLYGVSIAFLVVLVLGVTWERLGGLFSRRVRGYANYQKAKHAYDAWSLRAKRDFWLGLPGLQFERELAKIYDRLGYQVQLTPASGDGGVDLVLKRDGKTSIVQCKATRKPVGPSVARELYGTLIETGADEAILASVGGCTPALREFIRDKPMRVLGIDDLIEMNDRVPTAPE
jgi:hypothetical protein